MIWRVWVAHIYIYLNISICIYTYVCVLCFFLGRNIVKNIEWKGWWQQVHQELILMPRMRAMPFADKLWCSTMIWDLDLWARADLLFFSYYISFLEKHQYHRIGWENWNRNPPFFVGKNLQVSGEDFPLDNSIENAFGKHYAAFPSWLAASGARPVFTQPAGTACLGSPAPCDFGMLRFE